MSRTYANPCPCEQSSTYSSFGPVLDDEEVILFVSLKLDIIYENQGARISPSSFASKDINGAKDGTGRKSVSCFRGGGKTCYESLVSRACSKNKEPDWAEDPVVAIAIAGALRNIVDPNDRREICVYADKTDESDPHGIIDSHVSIRKSDPAYDRHQRQDIAIIRSKLSDSFSNIRHLISGKIL